jgi:hypothetical protein
MGIDWGKGLMVFDTVINAFHLRCMIRANDLC